MIMLLFYWLQKCLFASKTIFSISKLNLHTNFLHLLIFFVYL
nr:MAG TPA: hypothetical protein [Caudoviricetes sp.]